MIVLVSLASFIGKTSFKGLHAGKSMPFLTVSRRVVLLSFTSSNVFLPVCHVHPHLGQSKSQCWGCAGLGRSSLAVSEPQADSGSSVRLSSCLHVWNHLCSSFLLLGCGVIPQQTLLVSWLLSVLWSFHNIHHGWSGQLEEKWQQET